MVMVSSSRPKGSRHPHGGYRRTSLASTHDIYSDLNARACQHIIEGARELEERGEHGRDAVITAGWALAVMTTPLRADMIVYLYPTT